MGIYQDYMRSVRSVQSMQPETRAVRPMGGLMREFGKTEGRQQTREMSTANTRYSTETALANQQRDISDASRDAPVALAVEGASLGVKLYGEREKRIMAKMQERQDQLKLDFTNALTESLQKQIQKYADLNKRYNTELFGKEGGR